MRKPFLVGLVGAFVLAAVLSQSVGATGSASSGQPVLERASALKPTRGGGSPAPYGYLPLHARDFARAKAAANARAGVGGNANGHGHGGSGGGGGGPVVTGYANVSPSFAGSYQTGLTPPDTTGAIGPDRYIEAINTEYAIYNRSGSLLNSGSLSALTGVSTGLFGYALSDPQMMWDAKTQRFYYSAVYYDSLLLSDNGLAVGWSKTATPSSASDFCQYAISFGGELPDYPKLGDSSDFLLYGYNMFGSLGTTYDGSAFAAMNKPPAGSSCPDPSGFTITDSGVLYNENGSEAATPVPANLVDDSNGTGYVVANADLSTVPSADFISVYSVSTNGTSQVPTIGGPTTVTVAPYSMPASAPQAGSSYLLDTMDGRFEAAVAAVDPNAGTVGIWTAHSVYGSPGGSGAEERWYEIDPSGTGSLLQSGTVGSSSLFVWNGAISPDRANNGSSGSYGGSMAMSVSTSSASSYPAIQFVSKDGTGAQSPLDTLVQASGPSVDFSCSSTTPCRWGDYSGASPDPAATGGSTGTVWLGNQYNLAGGSTSSSSWRTWLFAVTPQDSGGGTSSPPTAAFTYSCTDLTCTFTDTSTDTGDQITTWSWDFGDGTTYSGKTPSPHTYASGRTYTVMLTVTDQGGLTDATSQDVTVPAPSGAITLTATGYKVKGDERVDLAWSGATGSVDIYRDGSVIVQDNSGTSYTDDTGNRGGATYTYQVCYAGTTTCSNTVQVTF